MGCFFKQVTVVALLSLGLTSRLLAYSDADFDGVEDAKDRCPRSSLDDLVDKSGCVPRTGISLALGASRSSGDYGGSDTIVSSSTDLQLGFSKGGWYATLAAAYLESGVEPPVSGVQASSGMGDTYLGFSYTRFFGEWSLGGQGVLKLATAERDIGTGNNDIGAYMTAAKMQGDWSFFGTAGHLVTGDDAQTTYNDIGSLNIGLGKRISEPLFISLSAARSDALLDGLDPAKSLSLFVGYQLDRCWYLNGSYIAGFSDSVADHSIALMAGYRF